MAVQNEVEPTADDLFMHRWREPIAIVSVAYRFPGDVQTGGALAGDRR